MSKNLLDREMHVINMSGQVDQTVGLEGTLVTNMHFYIFMLAIHMMLHTPPINILVTIRALDQFQRQVEFWSIFRGIFLFLLLLTWG